MRDEEFLHDSVSARGIIVQVDAVAGVGLDVGFKGARGWECVGDLGWDGHAVRGAVAAAEDEVLFCCGGGLVGVASLIHSFVHSAIQ